MWQNSDFSDLLRLFTEHGVRYLVVGGYAVAHYAEPRYTKDLDLWVAADPANARAVFRALAEFGAPLVGLAEADFTDSDSFYQMGVPPSRVDVLMGIPGLTFEDAWEHREEVILGGVPVPFIGRNDLVTAKRAAGRLQDQLDLEALQAPSDAPPDQRREPGYP